MSGHGRSTNVTGLSLCRTHRTGATGPGRPGSELSLHRSHGPAEKRGNPTKRPGPAVTVRGPGTQRGTWRPGCVQTPRPQAVPARCAERGTGPRTPWPAPRGGLFVVLRAPRAGLTATGPWALSKTRFVLHLRLSQRPRSDSLFSDTVDGNRDRPDRGWRPVQGAEATAAGWGPHAPGAVRSQETSELRGPGSRCVHRAETRGGGPRPPTALPAPRPPPPEPRPLPPSPAMPQGSHVHFLGLSCDGSWPPGTVLADETRADTRRRRLGGLGGDGERGPCCPPLPRAPRPRARSGSWVTSGHATVPDRRGIAEAPPPRARTRAGWLGKVAYTRASSSKRGLSRGPSERGEGCSVWCQPRGARLVRAVPHGVGRELPNGPPVWQLVAGVAGDQEAAAAGTLLAGLPDRARQSPGEPSEPRSDRGCTGEACPTG